MNEENKKKKYMDIIILGGVLLICFGIILYLVLSLNISDNLEPSPTPELDIMTDPNAYDTASSKPKPAATSANKPIKLRKICTNTNVEEIINIEEEVNVGIVEKDAKKWYLNGASGTVKITSGGTSKKLQNGELAAIKGVKLGKIQIVVHKSDNSVARCNVIVVNNSKETGWKSKTVDGKVEWLYYDNGYYKNTIKSIDGNSYYFDSNGYLVKNKEITYDGSKYMLNAHGQVMVGCVNGKFYNTNHNGNFGKYQKTCSDTSEYGLVKAKSINIDAPKTTIKVGEKLKLSKIINPINTNATTKWSSSNTEIVSIDKYGIIEGLKEGSSTITVKNGSKSATIKITVKGTLKNSYQDGFTSDGVINNSAFGIIKNASSKGKAYATTTGITKALAKAKEKGLKVVKLEPGVYVVDIEQFDNRNSGIIIPDGVTLDLNGSVIKLYSNNLYWYNIVVINGNTKASGIKNGIIEGDSLKHKCLDGTLYSSVRACFLEGSHERGSGIRIWNSQNVTIENMEIYNVTGDAINVGSDNDGTRNITIKNNDLHNCRRQGISISCAYNVSVTNNLIHDIYGSSPESAIDLESAGNKNISEIKITKNKFFNNGYYYNTRLYDVLLAVFGSICDVRINNNEYVSGVLVNSKYIYEQCKASNQLDMSNNKKINYSNPNVSQNSSKDATPNPNKNATPNTSKNDDKKLSLNKSSIDLEIGKKYTLTATIKDVMWSSSNPKVAVVNNSGVVIAVGKGTAKITAKTKSGVQTATCTVKAFEYVDLVLMWGQSNMVGSPVSGSDTVSSSTKQKLNSYGIDKDIVNNIVSYNRVNVSMKKDMAFEYLASSNSLVDISTNPSKYGENLYYNNGKLSKTSSNGEELVMEQTKMTNMIPYFVKEYTEKTKHKVVVVFAARGAQQIAKFAPTSKTNIYNAMVKKYKMAETYLKNNNYVVSNKFYVVYQGESDVRDEIASQYESRYMKVHSNLKKDLGLSFGAMVYMVRGDSKCDNANLDTVRNAQKKMVKNNSDLIKGTDFPYNMHCVKNNNEIFGTGKSNIHLNAFGLSQVGKQVAISVVNSKKIK